jgi:hypothetical protein
MQIPVAGGEPSPIDALIENEKEVAYSEINYLSVVKNFLDFYISYIATLPDSEQKIQSKNKVLAENIIESMDNPPFRTMRFGGNIDDYLDLTHNVNLKPEIIEFINNHPAFSKPFDCVQAIKDLRKLSTSQKVGS